MKKILLITLLLINDVLHAAKPGTGNTKKKGPAREQKKPLCKTQEQIDQIGQWINLKKNWIISTPKDWKQTGCPTKNNLFYELPDCSLPYTPDEVVHKPRRVVFMGDSLTDIHAESFAWYFTGELPERSCKFGAPQMFQMLLSAGFEDKDAAKTVNWLNQQLRWEKHVWWGCSKNVSYIPFHRLPALSEGKAVFRAVMHIVKNFGSRPLNKDDVLVMNWGLHMSSNDRIIEKFWTPAMEQFINEWKEWRREGDAPKLIYRQVSPQHWGTDDGVYSPESFAGARPGQECADFRDEQHIEEILKNEDTFPSRNDQMFNDALARAGLMTDETDVALLPIWRATAARSEEHPTLNMRKDCTTYCTHSSVTRFWNSALLALIDGMAEKQEIYRQAQPRATDL